MSRSTIGFIGRETHPWPSVERTRAAFISAFPKDFDISFLDGKSLETNSALPPVVINFGGRDAWQFKKHPATSLMMIMHGGPVLDRAFLKDHLGRLHSTDALIVNSTSDIQILKEFFACLGPHILQLPLPVDTNVFRPRSKAKCRELVGCESFDFIVGFVARLLPQKNLHQFLRELKDLQNAMAPRTVGGLVIGDYWADYPCLPYCTDQYPNRITELIQTLGIDSSLLYFKANLTDDELATCYSAMDLLYHPTVSIDENFGYVPVEAMAAGIPVVATAYGGIKDTMLDNRTGFLMPSWVTTTGIRVDTLRGHLACVRLLTDTNLHSKIATAASTHIQTNYSQALWSVTIRKVVEAVYTSQRESNGVTLQNTLPLTDNDVANAWLPETQVPWSHYVPSVAKYASNTTPDILQTRALRLAAPLTSVSDSEYVLQDPAWPGCFILTSEERRSIEIFSDWFPTEDAMAHGLPLVSRYNRWIKEGLLTCSLV